MLLDISSNSERTTRTRLSDPSVQSSQHRAFFSIGGRLSCSVMDDPALASLSLTHVRYVSSPHSPITRHPFRGLTCTESQRSHIVCLSMARPSSSGTLRNVCDPDMGNS